MQIENKQTQYENLCRHIEAINKAMFEKQAGVLDSQHLPVDTLVTCHKKMLEMGHAVSWLMHIRATQFVEFMPKNGQQSSIITN